MDLLNLTKHVRYDIRLCVWFYNISNVQQELFELMEWNDRIGYSTTEDINTPLFNFRDLGRKDITAMLSHTSCVYHVFERIGKVIPTEIDETHVVRQLPFGYYTYLNQDSDENDIMVATIPWDFA